MKVLLFGTSANPPTGKGGHAGIVAWAAQHDLPGFGRPDRIWVLPVFRHAFVEKERAFAPFEDRVAMAKLAFEGLAEPGRIEVQTTEREVHASMVARGEAAPRVGTIDVVRALEAEHPGIELGLLLGADTYQDLLARRWKESEVLLRRIPLVVVPRIGIPNEGAIAEGPGLGAVSSSALRASKDPAVWAREIQPEVLSYIYAHHLYGLG
jgi:nicotinate (nicotinamide) nucleotide adenylyltransferase